MTKAKSQKTSRKSGCSARGAGKKVWEEHEQEQKEFGDGGMDGEIDNGTGR